MGIKVGLVGSAFAVLRLVFPKMDRAIAHKCRLECFYIFTQFAKQFLRNLYFRRFVGFSPLALDSVKSS